MKINKFFFIWLLLLVFFKETLFIGLVPIWHTPDEQAHFAQVAYFAQFNKMPGAGPDLNREIFESEKLLGTLRDDRGNNKFTFNPEYRIEYTDSFVGKYEQEIKNLPRSYRSELVRYESANYPPLYYWLSGLVYKLFYYSDLITRIFATRFVSIILHLLMVYFAWLIAKEVFPKNKLNQITLPVIVGFQPMLSFVSVGINSDNLFNLLFTIIIYLNILVIKYKVSRNKILVVILVLSLTYLTKPQFILAIPMIILALLFSQFLNFKHSKIYKAGMFSLMLFLFGLGIIILMNRDFVNIIEKFYPQSFFPESPKINISFITFFQQTLLHSYKEVVPWYWGVFNWLGVTFPRDVHRVINRILIIAAIGIFIYIWKIVKKRTKEDYIILYLILASLFYFLGITIYNYLFTLNHGFPFGIQGRYYFPTIVSHMVILLVGLISIIPEKLRLFRNYSIKIIGLSMIVLNFIAIWTIAKSYYDLSSVNNFIIQVSQYKPVIFKGNLVIVWFILYLFVLFLFLLKYLKIKPIQDGKKS